MRPDINFTKRSNFRRHGSPAVGISKKRIEDHCKTASRGILVIFALVCSLALLASCGTSAKKPPQKKPPAIGTKPQPPKPAAEPKAPTEVVRTNAKPSTSDVVTPKRQASMRLIEKGKTHLAENNLPKATAMFRDAVNVDPSNGIAYFYLADADAKIGLRDVALGLLDKAEALLGADEEWMTKINNLRSELGAGASKPIISSPIDTSF